MSLKLQKKHNTDIVDLFFFYQILKIIQIDIQEHLVEMYWKNTSNKNDCIHLQTIHIFHTFAQN